MSSFNNEIQNFDLVQNDFGYDDNWGHNSFDPQQMYSDYQPSPSYYQQYFPDYTQQIQQLPHQQNYYTNEVINQMQSTYEMLSDTTNQCTNNELHLQEFLSSEMEIGKTSKSVEDEQQLFDTLEKNQSAKDFFVFFGDILAEEDNQQMKQNEIEITREILNEIMPTEETTIADVSMAYPLLEIGKSTIINIQMEESIIPITINVLETEKVVPHVVDNQENVQPSLKCEYCDKSFIKMKYLKMHKSAKHKNYSHKCSKCSKKFENEYNLGLHLASHNTKPWKCGHCNLSFAGKQARQRHEKSIHFPEQMDFRCNVCDKPFYRMDHCRRHMLTHTKTRKAAAKKN